MLASRSDPRHESRVAYAWRVLMPTSADPVVVRRIIRTYFIKPSRYDDRGRLQCFWKGVLPNNTLTVLAALNEAYNELRGDTGVHVETVLWDEIVDGPILPSTIAAIRERAREEG